MKKKDFKDEIGEDVIFSAFSESTENALFSMS
jgi:hypothetical protein